MSDDETKLINNPSSFQERVLAQLEDLDSRLAALEKGEDERGAETRAGFEGFVGEFHDMKNNITIYLDNFDEKLDVFNSEILQLKVDQRSVERRVRKLEVENRPQVITQEKGF